MLGLSEKFVEAAEHGDAVELKSILDEGFPVNYQDPSTGLTALHYAAAYQSLKSLRVLLQQDDLDFLVRDNKGRLASELAFVVGEDPAVARLLRIKERKQAEAQGIKLTRRPRP